MGKGDKKSKKGKISMGSFGVSRPSKSNLRQEEKLKVKETAEKPKATKAPVAEKEASSASKMVAPKVSKPESVKPAKKETAAKK